MATPTFKESFIAWVQEYGCKNEELAINYYTRLDQELTKAGKTWPQINFQDFVNKSIAYANIGIDPLAPKTLSFVLFKDNVVFIEDVRCMETLARKYGINCPENITVELIYTTDKFALIKKDLSHPIEGYVLEVTNVFNRGEICGGVSLSEYKNTSYNKARVMSLADIEKRVKTNSSFWTNWKPEMCEKTIGKNAWGKVVLDTTQLADYYASKSNEEELDFSKVEELSFEPEQE